MTTLRREALLAAAAMALALASPAGAGTGPRTATTVGGVTRPAWFVCDTLDAPMEIGVGVRSPQGVARITLFPKSAPAAPHGADYAVGEGDPGAGQVYYPLSQGGKAVGSLHAVNPGAFDPETPVVLPPLSSVEIAGARAQCRLIPGGRFIGFTTRRSVAVIRTRAGLAYQTFDFARPDAHLPSADVQGGAEQRRGSAVVFRFQKAGYRYEVAIPPATSTAPATLSVLQGGRLIQREPFIAYSAAP